jgi:hypothetical protein
MKSKPSIDLVQLGILGISIITMLAGFAVWCDSRYAHSDTVAMEIEARHELKAEVDALYLKLIPEQEKKPLQHHEEFPR